MSITPLLLVVFVDKKAELPHPISACIFHIVVDFWRAYLGWSNQGKLFKNSTETGCEKCLQVDKWYLLLRFFLKISGLVVQFVEVGRVILRPLLLSIQGLLFPYSHLHMSTIIWDWWSLTCVKMRLKRSVDKVSFVNR